MKRILNLLTLTALMALSLGLYSSVAAAPRNPTEKPGPPKSGFYDFYDASAEFGPGVGNVQNLTCTVSASTQPGEYAGNMLIDCDGEVPHNETTIVVDPNDPNHAVGGYHSYQLQFKGATIIPHIISTVSVTFDGGATWQEVVPPITPYQFTGDPALAFDANSRLYFANIADHEGQGGNFTGPSVVVANSGDGGLTWSNPVTVAPGKNGIDARGNGVEIFQDKEYIAADASAASPFQNRVYVTWTSYQSKFSSGASPIYFRAPIMLSYSDDGVKWSKPKEISGFSSACAVAAFGAPNECDQNQFSIPSVAPSGRVYVTFENFNTLAENQVMIVWSEDGGVTWTNPVRIDTIYDYGWYPSNVSGRFTLTGCQFRLNSMGNVAVDPADSNILYAVWDDNRNGSVSVTNNDIFLGRSTDGGATWRVYTVDATANDQFYPWLAVAPDGRVDIGYMDRSYSADQSVCQYGFTLARATFDGSGGITVTRTRVDTGLSDPGNSRWFSGATDGNGTFIGDYNGLAVGSNGNTWTLWTDQRNIILNSPSVTRNHGQHAVGAVTP